MKKEIEAQIIKVKFIYKNNLPSNEIYTIRKINNLKKNNNSFCKRNYKIIIVLGSIIIAILIALIICYLVNIFKEKNNKNENIQKNEIEENNVILKKCNDKCLLCYNFTKNEECKICKEAFDLYQGECISYAFQVVYHVDYYYEKVKIFNPNLTKNIYAVKIDGIIQKPKSEYNFNSVENNIV